MKAIFIRHGESTANVGIPTSDMSKIELTALGHMQAAQIAAHWTAKPTLIATSVFLRTQLTAQPTMSRFADAPVEIFPMEEFTYLEPSRWRDSTREQRLPYVESYWSNADPSYRDGPDAESFSMLLGRVRQTLVRLDELPAESLVYAFSHGLFMQVLRMSLLYPNWSDQKIMANYIATNKQNPIHNIGLMTIIRTKKTSYAQWLID